MYRIYYAQNREDLIIKGFFPDIDNGFYIDVGANDPVIDSVTKLFYDNGWSGINIEPISKHIEALNRERQRDINLQIGLSDKKGKLAFVEYLDGDGLSTFDKSIRSHYENDDHKFPTKKFKEYKVDVETLESVIKEHKPKHIHFIKIDVEGYEYEVISGYNWDDIRPELICIETNHIHKNWQQLLENKNYKLVFFDGINNYYLAKESLHRNELFNYPDIVFPGNPIYYSSFLGVLDEREKIFNDYTQTMLARAQDQEKQVMLLQQQQRNVRYLAARLYAEVHLRVNKRAKGSKQKQGLKYYNDSDIKSFISNSDKNKKELLTFIHNRDVVNIKHKKIDIVNPLKPLLWKLVAKTFNVSTVVLKKMAAKD